MHLHFKFMLVSYRFFQDSFGLNFRIIKLRLNSLSKIAKLISKLLACCQTPAL